MEINVTLESNSIGTIMCNPREVEYCAYIRLFETFGVFEKMQVNDDCQLRVADRR